MMDTECIGRMKREYARNVPVWEEHDEDWQDADIGGNECFLNVELRLMYDLGLTVYEVLRKYQGTMVPKVLGAVEMRLGNGMSELVIEPADMKRTRSV